MRFYLETDRRTHFKTAIGAMSRLRSLIYVTQRDMDAILHLVEKDEPFRYAICYGFDRVDFVAETLDGRE